MYWQSHRYYQRITRFLLNCGSNFWLIFTYFGDVFFDAFLTSFLAPFWAADRLFILTPKSRKTRAKPESVQGPPRGRFWSHFGVHFGLILGAFWDHFGSVWGNFRKYTQNTCNYVQIRANYMQIRTDVRKILSNMRKCRRSYVKIAENCMNFWNRFGRKLQAVCWQCYHFVLKSSSSSSRRVASRRSVSFAGSLLAAICWQFAGS